MNPSQVPWRASFGPFTLTPSQRLLERNGMPVRLGGRALDLLIVLVESAGQTLGKQALLSRVWPDVVVEEGSLRFHMVAVRKALGDGEDGKRYVVSSPNKGYTFVAEVVRCELGAAGGHVGLSSPGSLPPPMGTIVGRDEDVADIVRSVAENRLVSIVGPGGMGKTTVALAAAHALAKSFANRAYFIDLSSSQSADAAAATLADVLGAGGGGASPDSLVTRLGDQPALLVLDGCEQVIDGAAKMAELLVQRCPRVCVLASSREPLNAGGELVFRLQPLAFPLEGEGETAESALTFPAVKLFADRAAAATGGYTLQDQDAPLASRLCRELGGIALAIELAAGRMEAFGLAGIMSHFDASGRLSWRGRRTAQPRHQTLGATLDWSYNLLSGNEKRLLRRLSVFATSFSIEAAIQVGCFDQDRQHATELLASLVSKSLLNVDSGGNVLRYGLFDATRAFASQKLVESGEHAELMTRYSEFFRALAVDHQDELSVSSLRLELANLRASIEWYFRPEGDAAEAVKFASSLCPLLLQLSQVRECSRWAAEALSRLPSSLRGSRHEAWLQMYSARAASFTARGSDDIASAFRRGIEVAEALDDHQTFLHLLNGYAVALHRGGRFTEALSVARQAAAAMRDDKGGCRMLLDSLMGAALHLTGHISEAAPYLQRSALPTTWVSPSTESSHGFDHRIRSLCGLARNLWLAGNYAEGLALAGTAIAEAQASDHGVTQCLALIWAGSVHEWRRDFDAMEQNVGALEISAKRNAFPPYLSIASATRGHLLIQQGRAAEGVERVRTAVEELNACGYHMMTSTYLTVLAEGQFRMGLYSASLETCEKTRAFIEAGGDHVRMPELMLVRGYSLAATGRHEEAARSYTAAIDLARSQGSKFGELRAAVTLANQLAGLGHTGDARGLLRAHVEPIVDATAPEIAIAHSILA